MFLLQKRRAALTQPVSVSAICGHGVHFRSGRSAFSLSSRSRVATKRETGIGYSPSALALRSDAWDPAAPVSRITYDANCTLPFRIADRATAGVMESETAAQAASSLAFSSRSTAAHYAQPNRADSYIGPQQKASKQNGKQFKSKSKSPPQQPFGRRKSQPPGRQPQP